MSLGSAIRSFWHTLTSEDRHSSHDSPYRTGRHVPLSDSRGVLTSVATPNDSRGDVSQFADDQLERSTSRHSGVSPASHNGLYSPGLRTQIVRTNSHDKFDQQTSPGDMPMQSFQDGLPPPPPMSHTWDRIDAWAEDNYPELFDQLCDGATTNDLNDLEHQLDVTLPTDVRASLHLHDGQERGGIPTGIIFGGMLLDCEEIVEEWQNWRTVNLDILSSNSQRPSILKQKQTVSSSSQTAGEASSASSSKTPPSPTLSTSSSHNSNWRQELTSRQDSVPPNAVQKVYCHQGWIPLVRDWGGNNIAVDLAPGPAGHWGQVILFGRDFDTKYVIARSWAAFMAIVADDLNSGKWFVDEDSNELKLREFKQTRVEPSYFDILRWRVDQKYGRRAAKRRSAMPPNGHGNGNGQSVTSPKASSPLASPYMNPMDGPSNSGSSSSTTTAPVDGRGRTLQRLNVGSPIVSPHRPSFGKSSPLARVTEETANPVAAPVSAATTKPTQTATSPATGSSTTTTAVATAAVATVAATTAAAVTVTALGASDEASSSAVPTPASTSAASSASESGGSDSGSEESSAESSDGSESGEESDGSSSGESSSSRAQADTKTKTPADSDSEEMKEVKL